MLAGYRLGLIANKLQRVLNAAARVITGTRKFYHCLTNLLHSELHWLDIYQRIQILEKAVSRQLDSYLTGAKLFSSHRSAYRKFHSTETVLLRVTSELVSHLDKGEVAMMAFLDLSAAFDTVDKEILSVASPEFCVRGH